MSQSVSPLFFDWMLVFNLAPMFNLAQLKMIRPDCIYTFLACVGWIFDCTIYAYPHARKAILLCLCALIPNIKVSCLKRLVELGLIGGA